MNIKNPNVPQVCGPVKPCIDDLQTATEEEHELLEHVESNLAMEIDRDSNVSWAAFYASKEPPLERQNAITIFLPLFTEKATTVAIIKHSISSNQQLSISILVKYPF